jgi:hypothetical protein
VLALVALDLQAQLVPNLGGQRSGISALQFLKIGVGARYTGMGETSVAVATDVSSMFWNPAGLVLAPKNGVMVYHGEWLVDLKHDFIGAMYHLGPEGTVGISVLALRTDPMEITTETQPFGTGVKFSYSDVAAGVTYSRKMTEQFSFGITARYVQETLDMLKMNAFLFDLGTYYNTGLGSTRFGVVVANFGSDVKPTGTASHLDGSADSAFQSFSPPTIFKIGIAFEPYEDGIQKVTTSIQLNHPNDNAEHLRIGVEYSYGNWLFGRAGLKRTIGESLLGEDTKSADSFSLGVGVKTAIDMFDAGFDYSYTAYGDLGGVHRISLSIEY